MEKHQTQHHNARAINGRGWFSHLGLVVVLCIFIVLAVLHSLIVPITQGEDELAHYRYISFIAETRHLPANYAEREQAWYRADWPPLYHLLVGWLVSPLDTTHPHLKDVGESPRRRLAGQIFYPRLIIYTEDANWPWQDGILAWHLGRFLSIAFSTAALLFTYLTALELGKAAARQGSRLNPPDGRRPLSCASATLFATAVTALLAFTPRFVFTSAMLSDDSLLILLSAVFIWLLLRALRGDDRLRLYAGLGLLLGLSISTKYSTVLLPLVIVPVVWWRARQVDWTWLPALGRLTLAWLFTLIGASWWFGWIGYHFNTIKEDGLVYGLLNPLLASGPDVSMRRVFAFFGGSDFTGAFRPDAVAEGSFWQWSVYLFQTFWGVPILENDPLFPGAYIALLLFCLPALVGLWLLWKEAGAHLRVVIAVLALIIGLLLPFPLLRFFLTFNILETGQGRHILYPAAQSIPILLMLGWLTLASRMSQPRTTHHAPRTTHHAPHRPASILCFTPYVLLPLLLTWSIFQLIYMTNIYPDPLPIQTTTFDAGSIPQPLKHSFGDRIQFLGYDFQPDPSQAIINLTLFWKALKQVDENYRIQVQLVDPDGQARFTWISHPLNGLYPTRAWDAGDVIRDTLPLPLAAVPAAKYDIRLNLVHEAVDAPLVEAPLEFIQFDLGKIQPIPNASTLSDGTEYRLWLDERPVGNRQTIPLSWQAAHADGDPHWRLLGPDDVPRAPVAAGDTTAMFIVEGDWPSGDYRLVLEGAPQKLGKHRGDSGGYPPRSPDASRFPKIGDAPVLEDQDLETGPVLTVANELRLFELSAELAALPNWTPVEANFADQIELIGYALPTRRLEPGGALEIDLAWRSLSPVLADAVTFAVLLDESQQAQASVDRYPSGFYSPMLWAEGEVVPDSFAVPIPPDAPPGIYHLHLGLYERQDHQPRSLRLYHEEQPTENSAVVIGPFKIGGPPPDVVAQKPAPQVTLNQPLGDQITLLGYDVVVESEELGMKNEEGASESAAGAQPLGDGSPLVARFTFYWQANADLQTDYTTFLHLRDASGETVAQKDAPPAGGRYPSSLWDVGEVIVDEVAAPVDHLPVGEYRPVVGLYEYASGDRLLVPGVPANEVLLRSIVVGE